MDMDELFSRALRDRRRLGGIIILVAIASGSALAWQLTLGRGSRSSAPLEPVSSSKPDGSVIAAQVATFCGDCHSVPPPSSFPRDAWFEEVQQGFSLYYESGRQDLYVPPMSDVVRYFRELAPERLELSTPASSPSGLDFETYDLGASGVPPAVSFLHWLPSAAGRSAALLACDMRSGTVLEVRFAGKVPQVQEIATLAHPAHVTWTDLDRDNVAGLLVAELGSFQPGDHQNGKVIWLQSRSDRGRWDPTVIADGLGRVADVQVADFDTDGDADLIVAEFGWRKTGRILLLENTTLRSEQPQFEIHVLDGRHGTIHVPTADLNGDGHVDFVALISQEYEVIEAFLGNGDGTFRTERIFEAGDPSFGSSGIQLVDLDGDGDLDVLYTNGDTLDSHHLKPFHAVHWLENRGDFPFVHHLLTTMPGVCRALSADLDNDGDLDVVACAAILSELRGPAPEGIFESLIWLEQVEPGQFVRHPIDKSSGGFVALELGDFNKDGMLDIAAGRFGEAFRHPMTIWWNRGAVSELPRN